MRLVALHDRDVIEGVLRRDPAMHLYELGDLDEFFWPYTTWYALEDRGVLRHVALLYVASKLPVLLSLAREGQTWSTVATIERLREVLPRRFYAHLAMGAERALGDGFVTESHGVHERMILTNRAMLEHVDTARAIPLGPTDARELESFFAASYPGNWFDVRMLETGAYFGLREDDELVAVSGVHVVSRAMRVAALGNVATRPDRRGRGLARTVVAATCRRLAGSMDHVGLNVHASNDAAIRVYERLGFERVARYEEHLVSPAPGRASIP